MLQFLLFLTRINGLMITVLQGSNQSIQTSFSSPFVLETLPSLGILYTENKTKALLNTTYSFTQLIYDAGNPFVFSWALFTGPCLGTFTSFYIIEQNTTVQQVLLCIQNVLDNPVIPDINEGQVGIQTLFPLQLNVTDGDDFLLDVDGNPSPGRIETAPNQYVANAYFTFFHLQNIQLYYAITPSSCSSTPFSGPLYPNLYNGIQLFIVCYLIPSLGPASFKYKIQTSNVGTFSALGVEPYSTSLTLVSTPQGVALNITIPTNLPNPTFQLLSTPPFGLLSVNSIPLSVGDFFQKVVYTPDESFASFLLPSTRLASDDYFSFLIGETPFNTSSKPFTLSIQVNSQPLPGSLDIYAYISLLRGGVTNTPLYWTDFNEDLYPIKVNVGLTVNIPGTLTVPPSPNVTASDTTSDFTSLVGYASDVNAVLLQTTVTLSETASIVNGSQRLYIQVFNPYTEDTSIACSSTILLNDLAPTSAPVADSLEEDLFIGLTTGVVLISLAIIFLIVAIVFQCRQFCSRPKVAPGVTVNEANPDLEGSLLIKKRYNPKNGF